MQHGFGAIEIADAHADLPERRERDREARALPEAFVQVDGALGERERLLVAVANQRDVRLVAVDRRQHVVGLEERGHALGLPQRGVGFVVAAGLREHHRRQRMHHREVAPVAGGVQRGGGFGDVLAHDRHVADLPVALAEIEVGEADRARVVGDLGLLQGAVVERNRPRLLAAREGDAAVQAPQDWSAGPAAALSRSVSGDRPSTVPACARSPCKRYDSASMTRTLSSSSLVSDEGVRSSGASSSMVVAACPRSSAEPARAITG